jgi:hypothetical protein
MRTLWSTLCLVLLCTGCATAPEVPEEADTEIGYDQIQAEAGEEDQAAPEDKAAEEEELPAAAAAVTTGESGAPAAADELTEILVEAPQRARHEVIRDLMTEARSLLKDVELTYAFTGRGRREVLRGRPVAFALWSEQRMQWTVAHLEIPRPPVKWRPGGRPMRFLVRTPGVTARHVRGTGAERLMFAFTAADGEVLKVYGRKFPVFDNRLLKARRWRAVAATARPIVYLPFTEDTLDPSFVDGGRNYLLGTARQALAELRAAAVPSAAFPGELLADVVPAEVITTLAIIEQTDDGEYVRKGAEAVNEVLSQYGLKREEAYRYSLSRASALGPMQFTNRRGNGTYSMVVRRCLAANLDPDFDRGATQLLNAMKAAFCLLDIELSQMDPAIRNAYQVRKAVLGIFPVAAYNGGPRNVAKLARVLRRMDVPLESLRAPGEMPPDQQVACPCVWKEDETGLRPVSIPRYNNENRWYIEKYQNIHADIGLSQ